MTFRALTLLGLLAALVIAAYFEIENRRLRRELEQVRAEVTVVRATEAARARDDARLRSTETTRKTAASEQQSRSTPESLPEEIANAALAEVAAQTSDPAWEAEHFSDAILRVEGRYGKFFSTLQGWPPEKLERLKRQLAMQELALVRAAGPGASVSPDEASEALQRTVQEQQTKLREILGDADLAKFDQFANAESFRPAVAGIANAMRSKGMKISGEMEDSLVVAYSDAKREAIKQVGPVSAVNLTDQQRDELREQQRQAFQIGLMKRLSAILDPQQLNTFMESQLEQQGAGR
jgi:hypothetical protein